MNWLYGKLLAGLALIGAIFLYIKEKARNKVLLKENEVHEDNAERFVKRAEILKVIDSNQATKTKKDRIKYVNKKKLIEELENETDYDNIVRIIDELHDKGEHKD